VLPVVKLDTLQLGDREVWASCPAPGVLHSRARGHMDRRCARHLMRCFDLVAAERAPVEAFHDWREVSGYDSDAREEYTAWAQKHRSEVKLVHILLRSKMLAMAVAVARLKLDYMMPYTDPAPFEQSRLLAVRRQLRG